MNKLAFAVCLAGIFSIIIPISFTYASMDSSISTIYSKNGTNLRVLKLNQEVDVLFDFKFDGNNMYDGYAYFNIKEPNMLINQSQNFTSSEMPKTFKFSYTPNYVGNFPFTYGATSHIDNFHNDVTFTISVIDEYSKAMNNEGHCKAPFPEFTLIIKPDFSTGACVKMDTAKILKERGWH